MTIINRDSKRYKASVKLLEASHDFWQACHEEGQYGAVQWLIGEEEQLVIYTRGEYKDQLMNNIHSLGTDVYHFEEQIDRRREDNRKPSESEETEGLGD